MNSKKIALISILTLTVCTISLTGCRLFDDYDGFISETITTTITPPPEQVFDSETTQTTATEQTTKVTETTASKKKKAETKKTNSKSAKYYGLTFAEKYFLEKQDDKINQNYKEIAEGIFNHDEEIVLSDTTITIDDINDFMSFAETQAAFCDCTGFNYFYDQNTKLILKIKPKYNLSKSDFQKYYSETISAAKKIADSIPDNLSDYEKVLMIHDHIIGNCEYKENKYDQYAYSALCKKESVCTGYSQAFRLVCDMKNIPCISVLGDSQSYDKEKYEPHMWNKVKIDGKWYFIDLTWDDNENFEYCYFLLSDSEVKKCHKASKNKFMSYPKAETKDNNYFSRNSLTVSTYDELDAVIDGELSKYLYDDSYQNVDKISISFKCSDKEIYSDIEKEYMNITDYHSQLWNILSNYPNSEQIHDIVLYKNKNTKNFTLIVNLK